MIEELQTAIYEKLNSIHETSIDELDRDFDFNNIGVFFTLNNVTGLGSRNTFTLQVYIISQKINKLDMGSMTKKIDENINNEVLNCNAIIRHAGVWFNSFIDDDELQNMILTYSVDKF